MSNIKGSPTISRAPTLVADLPDAVDHRGDWVYATDGRKAGEGGGSGTGVMAFSDGIVWNACDTGALLEA